MRLSQGQLNLLERCPRQFQHTYLEQLASPASLEQQERLMWGSRFHLLMQQRELGLPIASLVREDTQLQRWISSLASVAPDILTPDIASQAFRESEHCRTLQVQDYLLTVIYDLLIADDRQAQILDWKTYPKPQNRRALQQNWQTRLYLYVLAETSEYVPEQLSMTYWFIQSEDQPQSLKFTYNNVQHEKTAQQLNDLLSQLTQWLQRYEHGEPFPQVTSGSKFCDLCQYATRCNRDRYDEEVTSLQHLLPNLVNIQEVPL
ncbi:PD-(D/E)XK nuclease family protein [Chroogloeocystis siderophila]|jgi:hypothetical protein|uniref:DNA/RNA helicase n=1 Tax=Chroogloeocystis siderophila 5.2 s.c.1 TaxID=247279 RepID=A0A1U7HQH5_9CHRO|nr:PD-(D/E)XK nuclease family protein [Chroogloeocystis siderophila]OKH25798.1 DNA/RNA helicase [Chroogloeocystis siderophila 5.2 s.c.1]